MVRIGNQWLHVGFCIGWSLLGQPLLPASALAQPVPAKEASEAPAVDAGLPAPPPEADLPQVEPIISDDEFDEAIPDFDAGQDPDLASPLETIEEFERRMAADGSGANPGSVQPAADGDRAEAIDDGGFQDAELARPLTPIGQFETAPAEFAEAQPAGDVEIAYRTEIRGLDEADRQTSANLRGMFDEFSALRRGKGKAANLAMVGTRLKEDAALIRTILASQGWYSPKLSTRIDRVVSEESRDLAVVIAVETGKQYGLAQIRVDAAPTEPPGLIEDRLALRAGEPVVAAKVLAAEANVAVALPENGYPFAKLGQCDIALDAETGEAIYTLPVEIGPRSSFGSFAVTGKPVFDSHHIEVLARFRRGKLYDSRQVDDLRKALQATGLFSAVSVEPQRTGEAADDGSEYVSMLVNQQAGPPRSIAGSAGYGTGEGFRLEASWALTATCSRPKER